MPQAQPVVVPPFAKEVVASALLLLPGQMHGVKAECELYAIGLQESGLQHRYQLPRNPNRPGEPLRKGPARGLWQFELGGGVVGVMTHAASKAHAERICEMRGVAFDAFAVWSALEHDDVLAAVFARLLLWTDPKPLPALGAVEEAWAYYLRTWRPGSPHKSAWPRNYAAALEAAERRKGTRT
jgi:hypothetical protein